MPFLLLLLVVKLAFTLAIITFGAWALAEFLPMLADMAVAASAGTDFAIFGEWLSQALLFVARYAGMFVDLVFDWLRVIGIDLERGSLQGDLQKMNVEAPEKSSKPQF